MPTLNTSSGPTDGEGYMTDVASIGDIVLPPFALIAVIWSGLLVLSCVTQPGWWRSLRPRKRVGQGELAPPAYSGYPGTTSKCNPDESLDAHLSKSSASLESAASNDVADRKTAKFISDGDHDVMMTFSHSYNRPWDLLLISLPAVGSLAFCPLTLFLHKPMVQFFWPPDERHPSPPNINDVIASFLVPAGLIYAIAFGFAFQEAARRQAVASQTIACMASLFTQISVLVLDSKVLGTNLKLEALVILKDEVITWMERMCKSTCSRRRSLSHKGAMRCLIGLLRKGHAGKPDDESTTLTNLVLRLDSLVGNQAELFVGTMKTIQWLFLECLGFFSFFGVLLLEAQSYRLEITLCMLTVFSISIFCYVLADLDQPFHGVFRIDQTFLLQFIVELQQEYRLLEISTHTNALSH